MDAVCIATICNEPDSLDFAIKGADPKKEPEKYYVLLHSLVCRSEQVRRHDRSATARVEDRKYFILEFKNGKIRRKKVATNRNKRTGQTSPSLRDYLKENKNHPPLHVIPSKRIMNKSDWKHRRGAVWKIDFIDKNGDKIGSMTRMLKIYNRGTNQLILYTMEKGKYQYISKDSKKYRCKFIKSGGFTPILDDRDLWFVMDKMIENSKSKDEKEYVDNTIGTLLAISILWF